MKSEMRRRRIDLKIYRVLRVRRTLPAEVVEKRDV